MDYKKDLISPEIYEPNGLEPQPFPSKIYKNDKKEKNLKKKTKPQEDPNYVLVLGEKMHLNEMSPSQLNQVHEKLISVILTEEEELIAKHREQLDKMCEFSRNEFTLLNDVERPGSDIDSYAGWSGFLKILLSIFFLKQ